MRGCEGKNDIFANENEGKNPKEESSNVERTLRQPIWYATKSQTSND